MSNAVAKTLPLLLSATKAKTARHRKKKTSNINTALHAQFLLLFLSGCCGVALRITVLHFFFYFLERPRCGDAL